LHLKKYKAEKLLSLFKKTIKRFLLKDIVKANFRVDEIVAFLTVKENPTLLLKDGTRLSSFGNRALPPLEKLGIPAGFQEVILAYILRYKYPHFIPALKIESGFVPRRWLPLLVHPQHKNTLFELSPKDRPTVKNFLHLKEGDQVLEIGSFIGFGTIQMSHAVGSSGKVVSIEADQINYQVLKQNIKQNSLLNVKSLNYAIGDKDDDAQIFWKTKMQANSLVEIKDAKKVIIKMRRIESVIEETDLRPDFMILTINGFELKVLESAADYLQNFRPLRIICPGWYADEEGKYGPRIIKLLKSLGFAVYHTPGMHVFAFKQ
jgi:FkbM family methyltransferase